jgi:hypothetical protein
MYVNMPIVDAKRPHPYGDTLSPKRFGAVSTLDPEFFSRMDDFADELLSAKPSRKYSPAWVASVLESSARAAEKSLELARRQCGRPETPEFRRLATDVALQCGLGHFFGLKFRAAMLYALYEKSGSQAALGLALAAYKDARAAWVSMAPGPASVYRSDVTFGPGDFQRGHWRDRVSAMDADIADMEKQIGKASGKPLQSRPDSKAVGEAIKSVLEYPLKETQITGGLEHRPPAKFRRGETVSIEAVIRQGTTLKTVQIRFRRINQGESWQSTDMEQGAKHYRAEIPGTYSDSPYPLQYYFDCTPNSGRPWFYPNLTVRWQGQPYFVIRQV